MKKISKEAADQLVAQIVMFLRAEGFTEAADAIVRRWTAADVLEQLR